MAKIVLVCKEGFKRDCWNKIVAFEEQCANVSNRSKDIAELHNAIVRQIHADESQDLIDDLIAIISPDGQSMLVYSDCEGPYMSDWVDFVADEVLPNDEVWYSDGTDPLKMIGGQP